MKDFFTGFLLGFRRFGHGLARIVNTVLLTVVYVFGVGITAILAAIFKKRFLDTKLEKNKTSYWKELNLNGRPVEDYLRQF